MTITKQKTNMRLTQELGAEFWNDSCDLMELGEAVEHGAVGATSNPVIVLNAVSGAPDRWLPVIDDLVRSHPMETEDELAWRLIAELGVQAARLLRPVYDATAGKQGFLCVQVNPQYYRSALKMTAQGKELAKLAPNVAIKVPAVEAGLAAMEELVAAGINVNATVSFSVSQAVAVAEAFERGMRRAESARVDMSRLHPYVTIMVGRVDDQVKRAAAKSGSADAECLGWAGVAVFKRAYQIFGERRFGSRLLAAAYRSELHWSELIGDNLVLSMPYKWWKQCEGSATVPSRRIGLAVEPHRLDPLLGLEDFRRAYEPGAMAPSEFARYGASLFTLQEFLDGYQKLLALVRTRMLQA